MLSSLTNVLHSPPCIIGLSIIGIMISISSHYARGRMALFWLAVCVLITPLYVYLAWTALSLPINPNLGTRARSFSWCFSGIAVGLLVWYGIFEGGWRRKRAR